ncbi:MAG: alpha-galactosidase, partial [Clostridia bacterium]|nr:alpha-galactosidase [Clostridia bacterium]
LDDGWFGKRDSDNCSLGDWYPDKRKLPNGIKGLAEKISDIGMKFGLWFEPEMISPDSDLYRNHPDWAIHTKNRKISLSRNQLVLDLSRNEVCEHIIGFMSEILSNNPISYVKWDMNRNISEYGDNTSINTKQDVSHRYIIGIYRILDTLTNKFPNILFEGCSGGGGRLDLGMLCYFPQYWTSDNTDSVERMYIQYGTSLIYPASVMGAHVSAVPNHQVGRITSIETRGNIAFAGRLGYELDLGKLTDDEKQSVKQQIKNYKKYEDVIHNGEMYRLKSPFETNEYAVEFVKEDKVIVICANIMGRPNPPVRRIKLKGLKPDKNYKDIASDITYGGDFLQNAGIIVNNDKDFESDFFVFEQL